MIYDVAVLGLGLSGASAAISLARRGLQVLALEAGEFPRHKVCGEFLSPESKGTLRRLGVLQELENAGAHLIHRAQIFAPNGQSLQTEIPNDALSISRFQLDAILAKQAQNCGVDLKTHHRVREVVREEKCWLIRAICDGQKREFRARRVIGAPGRGAHWLAENRADTTRYVGFKTHFADANVASHTVELHAWRGGYCGLSQIENGVVNACLLARYDAVNGRKPEEFWRDLLKQLPVLRSRFEKATLKMNWLATANVRFLPMSPLRSSQNSPASTYDNIICAGDAAGFIHPLTGDGMAMALRGGELAAATIYASLGDSLSEVEAAQMYESAWRREFGSRLQWSAWLQKFLIEPEFITPVLALGARFPLLGRLAVERTRGRV